MNWNNAKSIVSINDFTKRNIIESALISLTWENNINLNHGLYKFNDVCKYFLKNELTRFLKLCVGMRER